MINYQKVDHIFQAKNWLIDGWKLFKKKPLTWVFMVLIFVIFMIVGSNFLIGRLVVALLLPVFAGGIFIALDKANRNESIGLESLFSVFKDKPLLKELLTVGAIGVAVIVITMALQYLTGTDYKIKVEQSTVEGGSDVYKQVSEGSIFTSVVSWVWSWAILFGIPLVAINREPAIPALKQSLVACLINIIPLLIFIGMTILLTIISILPVGLGLFVLIPVLFGATYFAFRDIYVEAETHYISELSEKSGAIAEEINEQEPVIYTNNKAHQESDLKETYGAIRTFGRIGLALVAIGVIIAAYSFYSLQVSTNTIGEVVSVEKHQTGTGNRRTTSYTPTFTFKDEHGKQHTAPASSGSSDLNYPVGASVDISYNSDDFTTVQINSIRSILYLPMIIWLLGGALIWYSRSAKKNVDENGLPPRKSVFLKEGSNPRDVLAERKNSEINSVSADMPEVVFKDKQDSTETDSTDNENTNKESETDKFIELVLPKKFTLDLYDDYMHITLSWFGKKTFVATLIAVFYIGSSLVLFFSENTTITGSPLMIKLAPWISSIIGVGILYYTLTTWLNKTHIFVSQKAIEINHKPLPWFGNKRLETKNIKQLYSKREISSSTSNNRTSVSYHLHVISFDEDDMTLLKVENSAQALFLEQEIEKYLGIENLKVRGEIG